MKYSIKPFLSEEEIRKIVQNLAQQINRDYIGEEVLLVGLLRGSVMFLADLARFITLKTSLDFMSVSSYAGSMNSTGEVKIQKDLEENIIDRHVIIIEDIIDTGKTLFQIVKMLKTRNPKSLKICTLLDKPERREIDVVVDYVGVQIPDEFVVGYGMDFGQNYRNKPDIGLIVMEEE